MAEARPRITEVSARAVTIPTDAPESDGTFAWTATTIVLATVTGGGCEGLGYSYAAGAAAEVVNGSLADLLKGREVFNVPALWEAMRWQVRNLGSRGVCACAISAVDAALWDLKAKILGLPLCELLGRRRETVPVYGSGGFISYDEERLREQLSGWAEAGCPWVKMKVGRDPDHDLERVKAARQAIGETELFVDANGAWQAKEALYWAERYASFGVTWFEEPTSSDDLEGLRLVRERGPAGMDIAAGEYGFESFYFRRMLEAEAVDVLQADATRCLGITGFLQAAQLCSAWNRPLSSHCAPAVHLHAACAAPMLRHMEWFHDHVRIEQMIFDGAPQLKHGAIAPDLSRPGLGLELKVQDLQRYAA